MVVFGVRMENAQRMLRAGTVVPQNKIQFELIAPPAGNGGNGIVGRLAGKGSVFSSGIRIRTQVNDNFLRQFDEYALIHRGKPDDR